MAMQLIELELDEHKNLDHNLLLQVHQYINR